MKTINEIRAELNQQNPRSAWSRGVREYALELLESIEDGRKYNGADMHVHPLEVENDALNGATDWEEYSWGGCSLIYDGDIAARLCCPSELKKNRNGERRPNAREEWLDVQARALFQACAMLTKIVREV